MTCIVMSKPRSWLHTHPYLSKLHNVFSHGLVSDARSWESSSALHWHTLRESHLRFLWLSKKNNNNNSRKDQMQIPYIMFKMILDAGWQCPERKERRLHVHAHTHAHTHIHTHKHMHTHTHTNCNINIIQLIFSLHIDLTFKVVSSWQGRLQYRLQSWKKKKILMEQHEKKQTERYTGATSKNVCCFDWVQTSQ